MDLNDQIRALASKLLSAKDVVQTEEATKNAMIMPFIQILGYNVFDPTEVTPELVADVGTKKGEKVDYAILRDGKPIMLFECKKSGSELKLNNASQLFRYFHVTSARFGILTNGINYQFFTDLDEPNKMDSRPFLELNLLEIKEQEIEELKKFTKTIFDVDSILITASDLKYTRAIQNVLSGWMAAPSDDFVRLVANETLSGRRLTPAVKEQFKGLTAQAFQYLINTKIQERLKAAMTPQAEIATKDDGATENNLDAADVDNKVITTEEEIEAYHIVKSIIRDVVSAKRVILRDSQSYCSVLCDDNNRKPICRFRFNGTKKIIGIMKGRDEEKHQIEDLDGIYQHAADLKEIAQKYAI